MKKEDDEDTKILNLKDLDLNDQDQEDVEEIEFESSFNKLSLFGLDYKTDYFKENSQKISNLFNFKIINTIEEIGENITNTEDTFLALYYNDSRIINALIKQLKSLYPKIKIIIIANNLSENKVNLHRKTEFAVHYYFSSSSDFSSLKNLLK